MEDDLLETILEDSEYQDFCDGGKDILDGGKATSGNGSENKKRKLNVDKSETERRIKQKIENSAQKKQGIKVKDILQSNRMQPQKQYQQHCNDCMGSHRRMKGIPRKGPFRKSLCSRCLHNENRITKRLSWPEYETSVDLGSMTVLKPQAPISNLRNLRSTKHELIYDCESNQSTVDKNLIAQLDITQNLDARDLLSFCAGLCYEHIKKTLNFRCVTHKSWICDECIEEDHPRESCQIISFEEEILNRKKIQETEIKSAITSCDFDINSLENYITQIEFELKQHDTVLDSLEAMVARHKEAKINLLLEKDKARELLSEGKEKREELIAGQRSITGVHTLKGANAVRVDIKERSANSDAWKNTAKKKYEDESILPFSMGARLSTCKGLEVAYSCIPGMYKNELSSQETIENGEVMNPECDELCNIFKEKEQEISMKLKTKLLINTINEFIPELNKSLIDPHKQLNIRKEIQPAITKMLLLLLCESIHSQNHQEYIVAVRELLAYAFIKKGEKFMTAKIILKEGRLHLHCLKDENPPNNALFLPYESVRELVNPTKAVTFLEVGWPGNRGIIYINIGNNDRGKQFLQLTTGEKGPSYRNTIMEGMGWKGQPGEWICGGNYDGKGAAPLIQGLTENGEYVKPRIPGLVAGAHVLGSNLNAKFIIYVREQPQQKDGLGFGQVEEKSLTLVRAMAALDNVKDVRIIDCGVVLPLL